MIYAIRAVGTGFIKFGYVAHGLNLGRRLATLQTGCPFNLEVVATCQGGVNVERKIHNYLIHCGAHHQGEWFKAGDHSEEAVAFMRGKPSLIGNPSTSVTPIRLASRHRRLGAALALADKIDQENK